MLLTEHGKYHTNTIYISMIPGQLALITINCINHNKFVRSLMTSLKLASKQEKTYYTT